MKQSHNIALILAGGTGERMRASVPKQFMEIDGETRKLPGYNFSSNEQMTDYIIHSSKGQFPLEDHTPTPQPDPAIMAEQNDSSIAQK